MRSLGWAEYMTVSMTNNRQSMVVNYWVRRSPPQRRQPGQQQRQLPLLGGKLTISIVQVKEKTGRQAMRSPRARVLAELQARSKLDSSRPSDEVEQMRFDVRWEPENGALGVAPAPDDMYMPPDQLRIVRPTHVFDVSNLLILCRILATSTLKVSFEESSDVILRAS